MECKGERRRRRFEGKGLFLLFMPAALKLDRNLNRLPDKKGPFPFPSSLFPFSFFPFLFPFFLFSFLFPSSSFWDVLCEGGRVVLDVCWDTGSSFSNPDRKERGEGERSRWVRD